MPIKVTISHGALDDATPEEIQILKKHEQTLVDNLTRVTATSHEKHEWVRDKDVKHQRYFELRRVLTKDIIFGRSIRSLQNTDPQSLIDELGSELARASNSLGTATKPL